jgi:exodeoxyribonuclease V
MARQHQGGDMKWSPQQDHAITEVQKWLSDPHASQIFRLFGYAGTGKTTLARHLAEGVNGLVLYMCFTGKAALVLRSKGCSGASTIHSAIYKPYDDPVTGETKFDLNPESPVARAALVVVDEVSMVGEDLARDLLSFGTKVLVLGDKAQLPPVKGEGFFINAEPDVMLTEIHRQAQENPIIRMSIDIREGRKLVPGKYGDSLVIRRADIDKAQMADIVLGADQLLCGLNKTRQSFNIRVREMKGLVGAKESWHPAIGDRLVCLRNDKEKNLLNGGLWGVLDVSVTGQGVGMLIDSLDEPDSRKVEIGTPLNYFCGTENELDWRLKRRVDEFTYGWALTVHKSQGSQWDSVVVFDESGAFREDARKWLYTGVTRAAERVVVVV